MPWQARLSLRVSEQEAKNQESLRILCLCRSQGMETGIRKMSVWR